MIEPDPARSGRALDYTRQFIGGEWIPGGSGSLDAVDPYTGDVWASLTQASRSDIDQAVQTASEAFAEWRRTPGVERARLLYALADAIEANVDELAELETRDNGKIYRENRNQLFFAARNYRFHAGMADKLTGETKPLDRYDTVDFTIREPYGVVALITAWNSPLQTLSNKLAPALAAGNCPIIKPSEKTSVSTLAFGRLLEEVGFPKGVVSVVTGGPDTGRSLVSHSGIAKISFTGGPATAAVIAGIAAGNLVPATFELGGKSANVVFPDADLERALPGAVSGIFAAAGQTCVAGSRLLVHDEVYDDFVAAVAERATAVRLGDPMDPDTQMGPIIDRGQFERIIGMIEEAKQEGARVLAGGSRDESQPSGYFMRPTVIEAEPGMAIEQEEVFGPVLSVIRFSTEDEAIQIANGTRYGLAAGVWTRDINRALRIAKEFQCGTVWVNTYRTSAAQAPFGGVKQSGYGRERGTDGLLEYTRVKNTMIDLSDDVRDPFVLGT